MQLTTIISVLLIGLSGPSDAANAAKAAFSYVLSHPSISEVTTGRRVVLSYERTTAALKSAFPTDSVPLESLVSGRRVSKAEYAQIAVCENTAIKRCRLPSDVFFLGVVSAERQSSNAVILNVEYAFSEGGKRASSRTMKMLVERASGGWVVTKVISGSVG